MSLAATSTPRVRMLNVILANLHLSSMTGPHGPEAEASIECSVRLSAVFGMHYCRGQSSPAARYWVGMLCSHVRMLAKHPLFRAMSGWVLPLCAAAMSRQYAMSPSAARQLTVDPLTLTLTLTITLTKIHARRQEQPGDFCRRLRGV